MEELLIFMHGIQSRRDKNNVVVGEKRKNFNVGVNQGNFKKNRNGNGDFQGRNGQGYNNKGQFKRVYHYKKYNKNHPGRDCKGDIVTCNYSQKKGYTEYECFTKQKKEQSDSGSGNQVRSGFNQSGSQGSKPVGSHNNQESYNKPASESNTN